MGAGGSLRLLFFFSFAIAMGLSQAQSTIAIGEPSNTGRHSFVVTTSKYIPDLKAALTHFKIDGWTFHIINRDSNSTNTVTEVINFQLNTVKRINKERCYLMLFGPEEFMRENNIYQSDFLASQVFVLPKDEVFGGMSMSHFQLSQHSLRQALDFLEKSYTWDIQVDAIERKHGKPNGPIERPFGFGAILNIPLPESNVDGFVPASILNYGLQYSKYWTPSLPFTPSFTFARKIPDPQEILQDQLGSQIDPSEIFNSDEEELELDINATLSGHFYGSISATWEYELGKNEIFKPFVGAGLQVHGLLAFQTTIDTTVVIDLSEFSPGGGFGGDGFGDGFNDGDQPDVDPTTLVGFGYPISAGLNIHLNENWLFNSKFTYVWSQETGSERNYLRSWNMGLGLNYHIRKKQKVFYEYVRRR